jgi:hypothetical protein
MKCFIVDMRWNGAKSLRRESPAFGSAIDTSYTPTVMSVFKGSGREISSAVMFRLPSVMQAGAVEGGN